MRDEDFRVHRGSASIHEDVFCPETDPLFGFCIKDDLSESAFGDSANVVHRHPFYEMVFVDEADGKHIIDDNIYRDMKNVAFLICPGQTHYWKETTRARGILIYFNEEFLFKSCINVNSLWEVQLFHEIAQMPAIYMGEETAAKLRSLAITMLEEYQNQESNYAEVIRACLNVILIQFHRHHRIAMNTVRDMEQNRAVPSWALKLGSSQLGIRFQNLLNQRVYDHLSVAEYAKLLGVSVGFLNEQLKKQTGRPAGRMIREAQMAEAKRLLVNTEMNVSQIAEELNFRDTAYFCRAFKREVGLSPSVYRAECIARIQHYSEKD